MRQFVPSIFVTVGTLCAGLVGCTQAVPDAPAGPVAQLLSEAAAEAEVPRDLLVAIAAEEGGLRLAPRRIYDADDHVPVAGHLELRHGAYDSLARGAALVGVDVGVLVEDTALGTRAGAALLAELGRSTGARVDDLASWESALETLSGLPGAQAGDYARRVLQRLVDGGRFTAYRGEIVILPRHDEIVLPGIAVQALGGPSQFPGALWFDTSCTNKCNIGRTAEVDTIVIHDTEGGWDASVATLQNDPGKSVHYIVDADGSRVGQFRSEDDTTWHCGNSSYNARSVGIEHVGFADDPDGFQAGLYATSVALVQNIRTRHTIPVDRQHIIGHYQVPDGNQISATSPPCSDPLLTCLSSPDYGGASNHRDPGSKWQWCQYMQKLGGSCACNDAFSHFNCTTDKTQAVRCANGTVEILDCASPCEVQAIGEDDLCPTSDSSGRSWLTSVSRYDGTDPAQQPPAEDPPVLHNDSGCTMAGRAPLSSLWLLVLGCAVLTISRRRPVTRTGS